MGTATQISLEEYLGQSHGPDCEFLKGAGVELCEGGRVDLRAVEEG